MWIVCLADDSHEMWALFSEKNKMSSNTVVIAALRGCDGIERDTGWKMKVLLACLYFYQHSLLLYVESSLKTR